MTTAAGVAVRGPERRVHGPQPRIPSHDHAVLDFTRNHFELFGLPVRYAIDADALEVAFRELQRSVHPDRHAASDDASRRLSLQAAARVNEAYRTLADPVERARYLLSLAGVEAFGETDTALAFDFLERQLDRRERASLAAGAQDESALEALLDEVHGEAAATGAVLGRLPEAAPAFGEARSRTRELRFLGKLADDVDAMLSETAD